VFAALWRLGRWPTLLLIAIGFFAAVYRYGPNVDNRWRDCLPGAVLGVALWLAVSGGFRIYLGTVGAPGAQFTPTDEAIAILGQVVGAVVAAVVWTFLSSLALLIGGELNSEIALARGRVGPPTEEHPR
jgi:membrane protein